jgi:hypothetical protein
MRFRLVERSRDRLDHELIWGAVGLAVGLIGLLFPLQNLHIRCVFKWLTGRPCPTCGMTRSLLRLRRLDVAGAIAANPMIAALAVFAAIYVVYAWITILFRTRRVRVERTKRWEPTVVRALAVAAVVGNWVYLVAVGR